YTTLFRSGGGPGPQRAGDQGVRGHQERRHRPLARRGRAGMSTAVKVVRFHAGGPARAEALTSGWAAALAGVPGPGRPDRVALGVPLGVSGLPAPRFAAVDCQWFAGAVEAEANEAWVRAGGRLRGGGGWGPGRACSGARTGSTPAGPPAASATR